jgi:hydrogenase expression/formation protein HypE
MSNPFPIGKIPASLVERLWQKHAPEDPTVVVGPGVGLDVAVLDLGDAYLVAKSDPITFATDRIGWYAVHVNANDVACSGARPEWFLATILLPEGGADEALVEGIFQQLTEACASIGASLVGGHSEVTHSIDRPIVLGCLFGRVAKDQLVTTAGARAGDAILLTGGIPIEATAIIARERGSELAQHFDEALLQRARDFLFDPGISVLEPAQLAVATADVHAMHDPTEGGLATGLWELAQASHCDLEIRRDAIPILPEGETLCRHFGLDPLGAIASGALVLAVSPASVDPLLGAYREAGIHCVQIGRVQEGTGSVHLVSPGQDRATELIPPARDEIARLFD